MILYTAIAVTVGALALGFGIGIGFRLIRVGFTARRTLQELPEKLTISSSTPDGKNARAKFTRKTESASAGKRDRRDATKNFDEPRHRLSRPVGAPRTTSIHGITRTGLLRHTDGSYTRAYKVEMENTLYADEGVVDRSRNALAGMLGAINLPNVVVQFRHAVHPDQGELIRHHLNTQSPAGEVYMPARLLNMMRVAGMDARIHEKTYQRGTLTMWIRVPLKHANDPSQARLTALAAFFPALARELRRKGIMRFGASLASAWTRTNRYRLTTRFAQDEDEARDEAMRVFAAIEQMCPLRVTPFNREELWQAVYLGHRRNEHAAPRLSDVEGTDLREHLCAEDIRGDGEFLLHGHTTTSIVSLFRPPTPLVTADMMRLLTANPNLVCEHTTITEFITLDQQRAKIDLKNQHKDLSRAESATTRNSPDPEGDDPDASAARGDIKGLRKEMSGGRAELIAGRVYTVIYAEAARNREELRVSLDNLDAYCRQVTSAYGRLAGTNPGREHPEGLRALYPGALAGELSPALTGREFKEITRSMARLVPIESVWRGSRRPHILTNTPTLNLTGIDLFDRTEISSPLGLILASPGGGKSVFLMMLIVSMLSFIGRLRAKIVDYGGSCEPLVKALGGRHLTFDPRIPRTINIWDYEGLQDRVPPTELQISYVIQDALGLAQVTREDRDYKFAKSILSLGVRQVYQNEISRNRAGRPKHEPRHAHLVEWLRTAEQDDPEADACRTHLRIALESFVGDPFIDAPTHPDFRQDSPLDVYELKSLENFSDLVRDSLAFRIAARVIQSEGYRLADGTRTKMVLAFDELWEIVKRYPAITGVIERYARTGRKEGVFTLLATQGFKDIAGTPQAPNPIGHALLDTVGVRFIGLQSSKYDDMARSFDFTPATVAAIDSIHNSPGSHSQFVGIWGSGTNQRVEKFQLELTPLELWSYTSADDERNARAQVEYLRPEWSQTQVHLWLAEHYPQGLVSQNLKGIDEALLDATAPRTVAA